MKSSMKILASVLTAAFVSGAFAGSAFAIGPDVGKGDLNGDDPVTVGNQASSNEHALELARSGQLLILPVIGSANGEEPLPLAQQQKAPAKK
jgi:hypothetical protein